MGIHQVLLAGGGSYNISRSASTINEGGAVTFTITSSGVSNGTVVYWTVSGIASSRFTGGVTQGTVTIVNNTASVPISVVPNFQVDGATQFILTAKTTSHSGSTVAVSPPVTINDTSIDRPHGSVTFTSNTTWLIPAGVISATFQMCGGAGGGGGGDAGGDFNYTGGGGGGGSNLTTYVATVVGGTYLTITIGNGGAGGGARVNGAAGQATTVTGNAVSLVANGGGAGLESRGHVGGAGVYGANNGGNGNWANAAGGTSTNGGANGGYGGSYKQAGGRGGNGKCIITY